MVYIAYISCPRSGGGGGVVLYGLYSLYNLSRFQGGGERGGRVLLWFI